MAFDRKAYDKARYEVRKAEVLSRRATYRKENAAKVAVANAAWRDANKSKVAAKNAARYAANKEEIRARQAAYRAANPDKMSASRLAWARANPGKKNALVARRHAAKLQATPKWLAAEDHAAITELYEMAASLTYSTGIEHHVDHVVPLQGRQVKGLHVPWNLQVLQATDNLKKQNKLDPALLEPMRLAA